jgi:hypothetical protein
MSTIKLNGKEYPFKFNFNAIAEFEELSGIPLQDFEKALTSLSMRNMIRFIYCGVKEGARLEQAEFNSTIEDIGAWINEEAIVEIGGLAGEIMSDPKNQSALPQEKGKV